MIGKWPATKAQQRSGPISKFGLESVASDHTRTACSSSQDTAPYAASEQRRRILVLSKLFPSSVRPLGGVFVKERVRYVAQLPSYEVRVVSPIPRVPPFRILGAWYDYRRYSNEEVVDGLYTCYPRYYDLPKFGQYFHSEWMYPSVRRVVERLRPQFDFDLIDAHFAYPSGVVAAKLGRYFRKPVVITCRGSDILQFPKLPLIGRRIRWALRQATRLIAVSNEISEAMQVLGADPEKISVIPNGVDCEKFRPVGKQEARRRLGLPADRPIVLSVGSLRELKGMHLLVDAAPAIRKRFPDVLVLIVGGAAPHCDDYSNVVRCRVEAHGLDDHVRLVGPRPHEELPLWYSAADVFVLLSSREGSPNVLMEALACGTPAVATSVGGIPDVLSQPGLGILLKERSASAAAAGISEALQFAWDRRAIRQYAERESWDAVARRVSAVFDRACRLGEAHWAERVLRRAQHSA